MPLRADPGQRRDLVLVLAPTGRDAETVQAVLHEAGLTSERCADVAALCRGIAAGAGAALVAEEALSPGAIEALNATLGEQAPWSDLPIVLVTGAGEHHEARLRTVQLLDPAGNVTILERPFRKLTLVTAFESALRARRRQYQMREMTAALLRAEQERAEAEVLRRSEALYRALAQNYPNGAVLVLDPALRCTLAEGRGLADLGLTREQAESRLLADLLPPAVAERIGAGASQAREGGLTSTAEVAHEGRAHLVHCVPLPGARGEIASVMIVTQDITEQKRAEVELRHDAEFRERFLGVLAHDLRTPIQAVAFTADVIAKAAIPDKVRRGAERIGRAADRMSRMISDLLDLTRSRQGGGIPLAPEAADLASITRRTIDEIRAAHPERSILLQSHGDASGAWDADRISQVVSNLVGNALAYSPPDTPVTVDLRAADGAIVLAVQNRGTPIPPHVIPTLFAPFSRGSQDGNGEQVRRGLGLGLFIVDRIVEAHGGAVGVTSTAENGTTFTVTLPRHAPGVAEPSSSPIEASAHLTDGAGAPVSRRASTTCGAADEARRLVLIVEDDDDIRVSLREMLVDAGYDVLTAGNGRAALDLLAHGPRRPCLILLDSDDAGDGRLGVPGEARRRPRALAGPGGDRERGDERRLPPRRAALAVEAVPRADAPRHGRGALLPSPRGVTRFPPSATRGVTQRISTGHIDSRGHDRTRAGQSGCRSPEPGAPSSRSTASRHGILCVRALPDAEVTSSTSSPSSA
ncbi:MAG: ATP-binding protein [Minicystis sp.]